MRGASLRIASRSRTRRIDRVEHAPHRIWRVRGALEQTTLDIKGRGGVCTRTRGELRVLLHFCPRRPAVDAGFELVAVDTRALRQREERITRLGQPGPRVLMQIQRVMRLPEPGLPGGAHRHLGGRQGIRVDAREGEINEYPPHFARSNELAVDG